MSVTMHQAEENWGKPSRGKSFARWPGPSAPVSRRAGSIGPTGRGPDLKIPRVSRVTRRLIENGSVSLALLGVGLVVMFGLLVGSLVLAYTQAQHGVRDAADMAALTAATQAVEGASEEQACAQAEMSAGQNQATVSSCEVVRAGSEIAVKIEADIELHWWIPGLPSHVDALSYASNTSECSVQC